MADEFNFEITTKYKPEFKKQVKNAALCRVLADELIKRDNEKKKPYIDYTERVKKLIFGSDSSSIKSKLREQLHLDIDSYSVISDEERYNVLKLLHFIVASRRYEGEETDMKLSLSVLNLMINPSMEHTDAKNARHGNNYSNIIEQYRPAVSNPDYREETIDWIHRLWENIHGIIEAKMLEEIQLKQGDNVRIEARLKRLSHSLIREDINKLQRTDDGIIDTFYNMLISSRKIAEIEDMKKVLYDYHDEKEVPQEITDLFIEDLFDTVVTYEEFRAMINRKNVNLDDERTRKIWSLILCKANIQEKDLSKIDNSDYNFAVKYAEVIAEYWLKEIHHKDSIKLGEWIVILQELMCINRDKITYRNTGARHTNTNLKLTAAIKDFDNESKLPHEIVHKRLSNRLLLLYGTRDLFESKLRIDNYIADIEKVIFSYKNIEDIKTAHNYLYLMVMSAVQTDTLNWLILEKINKRLQEMMPEKQLSLLNYTQYDYVMGYSKWSGNRLSLNGLTCNPNFNTQFDFLMRLLTQDNAFRLIDNDDCKKYAEFAYEKLADTIVEKYKAGLKYPDLMNSISPITIYLGEKNQYELEAGVCFNGCAVMITDIFIKGKDIDSGQKYYDLCLI